MDGGNEIYLNIAPQWSGEDDSFDLDTVTSEIRKGNFANNKTSSYSTKNDTLF